MISGPVIRSGSPPARSSRPRASSEPPRAAVAGLAHQGRAAGVLLEAAVVAAAAQDAVGHDAHVADLGADAEGAAVELAVEHEAAADAGADGDQQQVVDVLAGAEAELAPGGGVGVVLDDDREVDRASSSALRSTSRQAMFGANITTERDLST